MTNITQQTSGTENRQIPLGAKLQSARESMNLDRKDTAAQLRLNESVIDMIENDSFPTSMPQIFIRGYIRSYGKLLQLSEEDIQAGLTPLQPKPVIQENQQAAPSTSTPREPLAKRKFLMQSVTGAIALTMLWLVAAWWYGHPTAPTSKYVAINQLAESNTTVPAGISVQAPPPSQAANAYLATPITTAANQTNHAVGNINPAANDSNVNDTNIIN